MDYTAVFKNAARIIWRHKLLLGLGLLLMSSSLPGIVGGHLYSRLWLSSFDSLSAMSSPAEVLEPIATFLTGPDVLATSTLITVCIFFTFILIWIISTIGEVSLIRGVADFAEERPRSFGDLLSTGVRLLVRIIAIDTVIFLPLFLILLLQLLILGGGMIAGILLLNQPGNNPDDLLPIGAAVGLVLLLLTILLVPVTILSILFRVVAFRCAVLEDLRTRPSIRRAWALIRAKIGEIIIIALLLYAISYAVGMLTSLLVLPFSFGGMFFILGPITQGSPPQLGDLDGFLALITLASVIGILPNLIYRVFSSAVWTMTYRCWQQDS
jgi:hypothetical protein